MFRWDARSGAFRPHWNSGVNVGLGYVWAKVERPGDYAPIGLPRDRLLQELLKTLAEQRRFAEPGSARDMQDLTERVLAPFLEAPIEELEAIRRSLATAEVHSTMRPLSELPIRIRRGGYIDAFPLPEDVSLEVLRERLSKLRPALGFPEEQLFYPPELDDFEPPWPIPPLPWPRPVPWPVGGPWRWPPYPWPWPPFPWPWPRPWPPICWFWSRNWWMYQHDAQHTGHASGCSNLRTTTVGMLQPLQPVGLSGTVYTVPVVVDGKVYVGTGSEPGSIGTLYKIDLATRNIDGHWDTPAGSGYYPGIGGSPAVVAGKIYVTSIPGTVHRLDAATMTEDWHIDLRTADASRNQPVNNPDADCWSSPLIVNGHVYVGCGEGESGALGFVYCLDAATGHVIWLFSTNKYGAANNDPNHIPQSAMAPWALVPGSGFTPAPNIPAANAGASIWSSFAYDQVLDRIYVGTGNTAQGDANPQPDVLYGSGVLALDATTGAFHGFYEPTAAQSYLPNDTDVDVCGSPVVFSHGGQRFVAIGSKSGCFFLFDASNMNLVQSRQLLPYIDDNPATPLTTFDNHPTYNDENKWGVFGTPAVDYGLGCIFVGLGGYAGTDTVNVPFVRALHWDTLLDFWPTSPPPPGGVRKYIGVTPPLYTNSGESGLSSPAIVNDLVFVATTKPGLYALEASTGHCKWAATNLSGTWVMGAAIYGNYVVTGAGSNLYIYKL